MSTEQHAEYLNLAKDATLLEVADLPPVRPFPEPVPAAPPTSPPSPYAFYVFADLLALRLVADRKQLSQLIKFEGFPKPFKRAKGPGPQGRALYRALEVHLWVEEHLRQAKK